MKLKGIEVTHKVFGDGVIKQQTGEQVTLTFESGDKNFMYNRSLRDYITIKDEAADDFVQNDIEQVLAKK